MGSDELNQFLNLCRHTQSLEELKNLFDLFLTIEEKQILASRYAIIQALLKKQLSQREIAKKYKVSIAQITRGSNALKVISGKMKNFLEKHL